jgi:hypothetical protein
VSDPVLDLAGEVERLYRRVRGWTSPSWRMNARAATAAVTRADRMIALLAELAEFGRAAGSGAPPGAAPEPLGEHALPDQLLVVANDLIEALSAPDPRAPVTSPPPARSAIAIRARAAVRAASADLVP